MFQAKTRHWFYYIAAIVINIGVTILSYLFLDHRFTVFFIMGSIMLVFSMLFHGNRTQIIFAGSLYVFSLYNNRGIILSLYSIILRMSIKDVLQHETYYNTIFALAVLLAMLSSLLIRKVVIQDNKGRYLLNNRRQLRFVVIFLISQLLFLMLINDGRNQDAIRQPWFSSIYLGSYVISKLWMIFVFNHIAKISELLEYERHTYKLQEQLSLQMRHYHSYHRFTEGYRLFRHEYEKLMTSVKTLLKNQEYEKAVRMLDGIQDKMQRDVLVYKIYSNSIILDAILQDAANICEEKNIRFFAVTHLPEDIMTELDIVHVFSNVIDNAIEACNKMISCSERFIEITSTGNQEWAIIEVINSFNGELLIAKNGELETTKERKDFHGFGLRIIKETIEGLGGLVFIEPDQEKRIFKIRLCIPKGSS